VTSGLSRVDEWLQFLPRPRRHALQRVERLVDWEPPVSQIREHFNVRGRRRTRPDGRSEAASPAWLPVRCHYGASPHSWIIQLVVMLNGRTEF
jgi:hypothetical protein